MAGGSRTIRSISAERTERQHLTTDERGEVRVPAGMPGSMMLFAAKLKRPSGQRRFTLDLTSLTFGRT